MVSDSTGTRPSVTKRDRRLGYERSEPVEKVVKMPYVSPYKQMSLAPIVRVKSVNDPSNKRSNEKLLYKNASVDELMARIAKHRSDTIAQPMSRLHVNEDPKGLASHKPDLIIKDTHRKEVDADDGSEVSHGSFNSLGSFASLGSLSVISKVSISGHRYHAVKVGIEDAGTGSVRSQELTLRAMIDEISARAKRSAQPPSYVPTLDDLPDKLLSWNGKDNFLAAMKMKSRRAKPAQLPTLKDGLEQGFKKNVDPYHREQKEHEKHLASFTKVSAETLEDASHGEDESQHSQSTVTKRINKRIDIIGMYQNVPLILARADERCRKQAAVLALKQDITEEKRRVLMQRIAWNMSRSERYAEALRIRQVQIGWLKVLKLLIFQKHFKTVVTAVRDRILAIKTRMRAATTVAFAIHQFIRRRIKKKIEKDFMGKIGKSFAHFMMAIKIKRKNMAVKKIRFFMDLFQGKNRIKEVIHRFVSSALLIQRVGRSFVVCHRSRIEVLLKIWDKLEIKYIEDMLIKRKAQERSAGINAKKSNTENELLIDPLARIEMEKQSKRWRESEERMEELLDRHRKSGLIARESLRGDALKMVLPYPVKYACVQKFVDIKRKEYLLKCEAVAAEYARTLEIFKPNDAHDLLRGKMENIDKTIQAKYQANLNWLRSGQRPVFSVFTSTAQQRRRGEGTRTQLSLLIQDQHQKRQTFVVKVRTPKKK